MVRLVGRGNGRAARPCRITAAAGHHLDFSRNRRRDSGASSAAKNCPTSVVVTGRFGDLPTINLSKSELPFLRFLEQPRVFYPGVELVVDSTLSAESDPYVEEQIGR